MTSEEPQRNLDFGKPDNPADEWPRTLIDTLPKAWKIDADCSISLVYVVSVVGSQVLCLYTQASDIRKSWSVMLDANEVYLTENAASLASLTKLQKKMEDIGKKLSEVLKFAGVTISPLKK